MNEIRFLEANSARNNQRFCVLQPKRVGSYIKTKLHVGKMFFSPWFGRMFSVAVTEISLHVVELSSLVSNKLHEDPFPVNVN